MMNVRNMECMSVNKDEQVPVSRKAFRKGKCKLIAIILVAATYQCLMFYFAEEVVIAVAQAQFHQILDPNQINVVCLIILVTSIVFHCSAIIAAISGYRGFILLYATLVTVGCVVSIPSAMQGPPIVAVDMFIAMMVAYYAFSFGGLLKKKHLIGEE